MTEDRPSPTPKLQAGPGGAPGLRAALNVLGVQARSATGLHAWPDADLRVARRFASDHVGTSIGEQDLVGHVRRGVIVGYDLGDDAVSLVFRRAS